MSTEEVRRRIGAFATVLWRFVQRYVLPVLRAVFAWIKAIPYSLIAFLVALFAGLFGMGMTGILLYFPVAPLLLLRFPRMDTWMGDWVWPTVIGAGMLWAFGFLLAGELNRRLVRRGTSPGARRLAYIGVLWLWDLVTWFLALTFPSN